MMNTNAKQTVAPAPPAQPAQLVQDEWGIYDPKQAGLPAAFRSLREREQVAPAKPEVVAAPAVVAPVAVPSPATKEAAAPARCRFCTEALPPGARQCPGCFHDVAEGAPLAAPIGHAMPAAQKSQNGAVYSLEFPTKCPQCHQVIRTFRVFRLMRTQVSFTSTLPRKGYVIVCPECEEMISTELSGMI